MDPSKIPPQSPPDLSGTPEFMIQRTQAIVDKYNHAMEKIQGMVTNTEPDTATFESLVVPQMNLRNDLHHEGYLEFLQYASPDAAVRDAAKKVQQMIASVHDLENSFDHHTAVYDADGELDQESKRIVRYVRAWARPEEDEPATDRAHEIDARINALKMEFEGNLAQKSGGIWCTEAELEGIPKQTVSGLSRGTGENEGKLYLEYRASILMIENAVNPAIRKQWFSLRHNLYSENAPIFKELVVLRHELAVLRGYPDHATYALRNNIIGTPEDVMNVLKNARERMIRTGDLESRKKAKLNDPQANDKTFYFWDFEYYKDHAKWSFEPAEQAVHTQEKKMEDDNDDDLEFRNYFTLENTIRGMFSMFETVFGIVFQKIEGEFWHENVELYAVWDEEAIGGEFCGYVYLDLCERPGKHPGGVTFPLQPRHTSSNGETRYQSTAIFCGFDAPTSTKPCLLTHFQILSLFHEMGHCLHGLFARVRFYLSGADREQDDFNETPSMLFEKWGWLPGQLKKLSAHYKTGKPIPDHLIKKVVDNREKAIRVLSLSSIAYVAFDLAIHTPKSQKEAEEMEIPTLWNQLAIDIQDMQGDRNSLVYCNTAHIADSYPGSMIKYLAGFYFVEYIWKKLFEKDPMSREAGMRWRRGYLEKGCTEDPKDMLEKLLGSWPTVDQLLNDDSDFETSDD